MPPAALGGSQDLHDSFGIPMGFSLQVSHPSWPNAALPGEDEEGFTDRLAEELEQTILEAGPETIGAMIAEPVSVSSGMFPPPASYFPEDHQGAEEIRHPAVHRRGGHRLWPFGPHVGDRGHGP